jgi:hypothetical protein
MDWKGDFYEEIVFLMQKGGETHNCRRRCTNHMPFQTIWTT